MIVTRDHVLGPEIGERHQKDARALLDEALVPQGDPVRQCLAGYQKERQEGAADGDGRQEAGGVVESHQQAPGGEILT